MEALSVAENNVVTLLYEGLSNNQIAEKLFVCEKTVKFHCTNIYRKTNVKGRSALLVKRFNNNYIEEKNHMEKALAVGDKQSQIGQQEKIQFIDKQFKVGAAINHLHYMMSEVTKEGCNVGAVNAACNCIARVNDTIDTSIRAARFLNER